MALNFQRPQPGRDGILAPMTRPPDDNDRKSGPATEPERGEPLTFWQIAASTLAAAFGVQSSRNRERDFTRGRPVHFIIAGVVFTALFVLTLILVVNLVL